MREAAYAALAEVGSCQGAWWSLGARLLVWAKPWVGCCNGHKGGAAADGPADSHAARGAPALLPAPSRPARPARGRAPPRPQVGRERMHFRPPEEQNDHKVTCGVQVEALPRVLEALETRLAAAEVDGNIITSGTGAPPAGAPPGWGLDRGRDGAGEGMHWAVCTGVTARLGRWAAEGRARAQDAPRKRAPPARPSAPPAARRRLAFPGPGAEGRRQAAGPGVREAGARLPAVGDDRVRRQRQRHTHAVGSEPGAGRRQRAGGAAAGGG